MSSPACDNPDCQNPTCGEDPAPKPPMESEGDCGDPNCKNPKCGQEPTPKPTPKPRPRPRPKPQPRPRPKPHPKSDAACAPQKRQVQRPDGPCGNPSCTSPKCGYTEVVDADWATPYGWCQTYELLGIDVHTGAVTLQDSSGECSQVQIVSQDDHNNLSIGSDGGLYAEAVCCVQACLQDCLGNRVIGMTSLDVKTGEIASPTKYFLLPHLVEYGGDPSGLSECVESSFDLEGSVFTHTNNLGDEFSFDLCKVINDNCPAYAEPQADGSIKVYGTDGSCVVFRDTWTTFINNNDGTTTFTMPNGDQIDVCTAPCFGQASVTTNGTTTFITAEDNAGVVTTAEVIADLQVNDGEYGTSRSVAAGDILLTEDQVTSPDDYEYDCAPEDPSRAIVKGIDGKLYGPPVSRCVNDSVETSFARVTGAALDALIDTVLVDLDLEICNPDPCLWLQGRAVFRAGNWHLQHGNGPNEFRITADFNPTGTMPSISFETYEALDQGVLNGQDMPPILDSQDVDPIAPGDCRTFTMTVTFATPRNYTSDAQNAIQGFFHYINYEGTTCLL